MSSYFYLDTNALVYAYQAGGANLVQAYLDYASGSSSPRITDIVQTELSSDRQRIFR
jgi:hypothetical protein